MKATAKFLVLAFLASAVSVFCTSCDSSSSNVNKPYGAGGTTTSAILGRSRGGIY